MMSATRSSSLFGLALGQVRPTQHDPSPPTPPVASNPRHGSNREAYLEAADQHEDTVQQCLAHLSARLGEQDVAWLQTLREAARLQGRCQLQAEQARVPTTDIKDHIQHKLLHVLKRLEERCGLRIKLKELQRVMPDWERQPVHHQDPHTLMRRVRYRGKTFYAVYELQGNGGKYLSTVVLHPQPPREGQGAS